MTAHLRRAGLEVAHCTVDRLVHELGHHATGATRPMLLVSFLAAPWRWTMRLPTGLASILAGCQPRRGLSIVVVTGLAVAVARAMHQGQWKVEGVLALVGLAAALCPLADAAISRQSEIAADQFTADHGLALDLAAALRAMGEGCRRGLRLVAAYVVSPDARTARPRAADDDSAPGWLIIEFGERVAAPHCAPTAFVAARPDSNTRDHSRGDGAGSLCASLCASEASSPRSRQLHRRP